MTARGDVPPALLLAALAWCAGTAGGSHPRDLAVATALVAGARLASEPAPPGPARRAPAVTPATVALLCLVLWMVGVGLAHAAPAVDTLRLPWLAGACVVAGDAARRLTASQREVVLSGLAALGAVLAVIALGHWARAVVTTDLPLTVVRAEAPLGYPNALAAILLATTLLTARTAATRPGPLGPGLVVVQLVALVATGSRLVLLTGTAIAGWYALRGRGRGRGRWRWLRAVAAGWSVVAVVVLVARFLTAPTERLQLWAGALRAVAADPVTGRGPEPVLIDAGPDVRPTTHAHNEVLQLAVEYGLVALALAGAALCLGLRSGRSRGPRDGTLLLATVVLVAPALTDFTLRVPAVALLLATVAGIAWRPAPARVPRTVVRRRDRRAVPS